MIFDRLREKFTSKQNVKAIRDLEERWAAMSKITSAGNSPENAALLEHMNGILYGYVMAFLSQDVPDSECLASRPRAQALNVLLSAIGTAEAQKKYIEEEVKRKTENLA